MFNITFGLTEYIYYCTPSESERAPGSFPVPTVSTLNGVPGCIVHGLDADQPLEFPFLTLLLSQELPNLSPESIAHLCVDQSSTGTWSSRDGVPPRSTWKRQKSCPQDKKGLGRAMARAVLHSQGKLRTWEHKRLLLCAGAF